MVVKRGSPKNSFKFCSDGICNNANSQNAKKGSVFYVQIFTGKHAADPLLYYAPKRNSTPPKFNKHSKSNVSLKKTISIPKIKNGMSLALPSMELFAITKTTSTAAAVLFGYFW